MLPPTILDDDAVFAFMCYICTILGGRFIHADIPPKVLALFDNNIVKIIVLTAMLFMFFRKLAVAIAVALCIWLLIQHGGRMVSFDSAYFTRGYLDSVVDSSGYVPVALKMLLKTDRLPSGQMPSAVASTLPINQEVIADAAAPRKDGFVQLPVETRAVRSVLYASK